MKINNFRYLVEVEDSEDIEGRDYYEYDKAFILRKKKKVKQEAELKIIETPSFSEYVKANMKVKKEEKGSYKNGRRK